MAFARATGAIWLVVAALAVGCGGPKTYELYFELDDPINAPGGDPGRRRPLAVDIVCLTPEDSEAFPKILDRTWQSSHWFAMRADPTNELGKLRERIRSLAPGEDEDRLISPSDTKTHQTRVGPIRVTHPEPGDDQSAIVIYAGYTNGDQYVPTSPVIIQPLEPPLSGPGGVRDGKITVRVAATSISRAN